VFGGGREPGRPGVAPTGAATAKTTTEVELQRPTDVEFAAEPARESTLALPLQDKHDKKHKKQSEENVWRTEVSKLLPVGPEIETVAVNTGSGDIEVLPSNGPNVEVPRRCAPLDRVENRELPAFEDHVDTEEDGVMKPRTSTTTRTVPAGVLPLAIPRA
jgi:hypothetical protein